MDFNLLGLNQYQISSIKSQVSLLKYEEDLKSRANSLIGRLATNIDKVPEFKGAGICYIDQDDYVYKLRDFEPIARSKPVYVVLRQPPGTVRINDFEAYIRQNNTSPRETRLTSELKGLGYNCGGMVLGWIGTVASGAGSIATFGFSSVVFVISVSAAISATIQCGVSLFRVYDQNFNAGNINNKLDSDEWYTAFMKALEAISLASATLGIKSLKTDLLTHGRKYVENKLRNLTLKNKKELTLQFSNQSKPIKETLYFSNLVSGSFSTIVKNKTIYKSEATSKLVDSLGSAMSIKGSIDTGGILNPNKKSEFSIGILQGLNDEK